MSISESKKLEICERKIIHEFFFTALSITPPMIKLKMAISKPETVHRMRHSSPTLC